MQSLKNRSIALLLILLIVGSIATQVGAYVFNGWVLSDPSDVEYQISSYVGQWSNLILTYAETWETYCSEIGISPTSDKNIHFYAELDVFNESYAGCRFLSEEKRRIVFYGDFVNATSAEKNETIVHEVGHALGLSHCLSLDVLNSVMRATGFNGKAYPLSDDIEGITALYGS